MTPDNRKRPGDLIAKQDYDFKGILSDSLGTYLTPERAMAEFVDNAIDTMLEGIQMSFVADFYPQERRIILICRGTSGMPPEEMKRYVRFGKFDNIPEISRQKLHGLGGKIAALWWLDPEKETEFGIFSTPPGSDTSYTMSLRNWHESLSEGVVLWPIELSLTQSPTPYGYTRMELKGVQEERTIRTKQQLVALAEDLGEIYGMFIAARALEIKLRIVGQTANMITVEPKLIQFGEGVKEVETTAGGVKFVVRWGKMAGQEERRTTINERAKRYGLKGERWLAPMEGHGVHVYHYGRHFEYVPLKSLGVPGYRKRLAYENFAVIVNCIGGNAADRNLFKTGWAKTDPRARAVYERVAKLIGPDVRAISEESEQAQISPAHIEKARLASKYVNAALNQLFGEKRRIINEFNLFATMGVARPQPIPKEGERKIPSSLPGTTIRRTAEESKTKNDLLSTISEIRLVHFGDAAPEAQMAKGDKKENIIELNLDNEVIKRTLAIKNQQESVAFLIRLALEALLANKWGGKIPYDESQQELAMIVEEAIFHLEAEGEF